MRNYLGHFASLLLVPVIACFFACCSNSVDTVEEEIEETYLSLDDSEYPYAGIPRLVIQTEGLRGIYDKKKEIPAKMQIYGENSPESEIMKLTIRGRGNTSWQAPKPSYKIEFVEKQNLLGMPQNRDWALVSNYADKTLMKNYLAYRLSTNLRVFYAPRCRFVELYLNKMYMGVYLLVETIKLGKNRVNYPQSDDVYVVEVDEKYQDDDPIFHSKVIYSWGKPFTIHEPKTPSPEAIAVIKQQVTDFEYFLKDIETAQSDELSEWIDVDEYVKFYWVQEFAKNPDANFFSSVYFVWEKGGRIKIGPVWDFDLAFGGYDMESVNNPQHWYVRGSYWNNYLFKDEIFDGKIKKFWTENRDKFDAVMVMVDSVGTVLKKAAHNNFKRWPVLESVEYDYHPYGYSSYEDAVSSLKKWIQDRLLWIDEQE